ncbi:GNAT family N-acetyltransferase [Vibrio sp. 10N.286.49.B3]|uniref:GNAT family N-acetyltransferase n=1 Tax=Vibrio sp. 10N.286.49.B3 TaxID=1880855 RepID=UPI000C85F4CD|nr:N-acetyltransferase [Vibrio sp. 10N.286.49.B3]PMH41184.1 GNAT family N-acetyltransferase [Vibrio sp. 10N.286.49.B3]
MLIRTEAPVDILAIDRLVKAAFDTEAEANLVMKLRENSQLTLSLVACSDDGEVIGHVMFSPVTVEGQDINWQGLAPLSVKKEYRQQGVASKLIQEALIMLQDFSYPACVVLGDPDFYTRFGFKPASEYNLRCEWEVPSEAFLILGVDNYSLDEHQGLINYRSEFSDLV